MSCQLYLYSCDNERDTRRIHKLVSKAEEQAPYFHRIYPWRTGCASGRNMVISMNHDDDICGWMVYDTQIDEYGNKCAYVVEVATSNRHRGIGRQLIESLQTGEYDYITLVPLPEVEGFYRHLGFKPFVTPYWIKWVNIRNPRSKTLIRMSYTRKRLSELKSRANDLRSAMEDIRDELDEELIPIFDIVFEEEPDMIFYMYDMDGIDTVEEYLRERSGM